MSVTTALARATYRHLDQIAFLACAHYNRSGRPAYYHRYQRAVDAMRVVSLQCDWRV